MPSSIFCAEREARGPFGDVSDFARRINPRLLNKRALETLAAAGALDELSIDRATALANVDRLIAAGNRSIETSAEGQDDLFSGATHVPPPIELRPAKPFVPTDRLSREFEAIGFFLTGHPLDDYKDVLEALGAETWARVRRQGARPPRGRHAGRHGAARSRAQGQDRQCLCLRRFLGSPPASSRLCCSRSCWRPRGAARAWHRGPARCRSRGRRRGDQDASPESRLAG